MSKNNNVPGLSSYAQLFATVATVLTPLILVLIPNKIPLSMGIAIVFLFLLGAASFFQLWHKARNAYTQNEPLPPPAIFWRILFHRLAPVKGDLIKTRNINILVIYDSSTLEQFEELQSNFTLNAGENLQLVSYNYTNEKTTDLLKNLRASQAIYLYWTQEISEDVDFRTVIDFWSADETQKPVLVVNLSKKAYSLPFDKVLSTEASTGLWKLLPKSIERTMLWHQQANSYRKVWLFTVSFALILMFLVGFFYFNSLNLRTLLVKRDQHILNRSINISRKIGPLREKISHLINQYDENSKTDTNSNQISENTKIAISINTNSNINKERALVDSNLKDDIQNTLNEYALFSYEEIMNRMSSNSEQSGGHISFWRLSPDGKYFQQIARSTPSDYYRTFLRKEDTIIRCAIEKNAFVLWGSNFADGEEASWNIDGEPMGRWNNGRIIFDDLKSSNDTSCSRQSIPVDSKTTGLLCLGTINMPPEKNIKSGVCIDVPYDDVNFLKESGTRSRLVEILSIMDLLPNELLKFTPPWDK